MKNQSLSKWLLIGLLALVAVLLIVVIFQLNQLNIIRSNAAGDAQPTESVEAVMDSPAVEVVAEEPIQAPAPEPQKPVTSPDLKWQRMQGPVKTVKETKVTKGEYGDPDTERSSFGFDREGRYKPEFPLDMKYTRNNDGQIIKEVNTTDDQTGTNVRTTTFKYDDNGYVVYECVQFKPAWLDMFTDYYTFTLDERGWIVSAKVRSSGDGDGDSHSTMTYTYSNMDEHGNWRKCVMKQRIKEINETVVVTRTRKITYWE